MSSGTVLVTGGSGFIAGHCIVQLLSAGYRVRTTVRSLDREPEVRATLERAGVSAEHAQGLSFFAADLTSDAGWPQAVSGCEYVLHVASPLPMRVPKKEDELIIPAREGTLRVLRAARDAGVKRVVQTSSFAAIGYGHPPRSAPFTEADWTNASEPGLLPYAKSKTLAERAAWDFVAKEGGALELSVVNPVAVLGPVLSTDYSSSIQIVKRLLDGGIPVCPRIWFGLVDVRDVAALQLLCMTHEAAKNERFLAAAGDFLPLMEVANILRANLQPPADKLPTREVPDWLVRFGALFNAESRQILPELGKRKNGSNEKAIRLLGWSPRSNKEAILATAESLRPKSRPKSGRSHI